MALVAGPRACGADARTRTSHRARFGLLGERCPRARGPAIGVAPVFSYEGGRLTDAPHPNFEHGLSSDIPLDDGRICRISPAKKGFPYRVSLSISRPDQLPTFIEAAWNYQDSRARSEVQRKAQLSPADLERVLQACLALAQRAGDSNAPPSDAPLVRVLVRDMYAPEESGQVFAVSSPDDFIQLLRRPFPTNSVIEWPKDQVVTAALVDLDFHGAHKPTLLELHQLGDQLAPVPRCWWTTTGGGLKAAYWPLSGQPYTAEELAVAAAASLSYHPKVVAYGGTVEVLTRTRAPAAGHMVGGKLVHCGAVNICAADASAEVLARFSQAQATPEEINEVLAKLGLSIGQRLPHSACVIDPDHVSKSPNPVVVLETGIYCHSCQGRLGNGFTSWGAVRRKLGLSCSEEHLDLQPIRDAAKHFVHFSHVWYLFDSLYGEVQPRFRRPLYAFLLKFLHGRDPRIPMVFSSFAFVRGLEEWLCAETLESAKPLSRQAASCLPSACVVVATDEGETVKADQLLVERHINIVRIPGWTPLVPCPFVPIYYAVGGQRMYDAERQVVYATPMKTYNLKRVSYVPVERRLSLKACEHIIKEQVPGIDLRYIKALIVAMGHGESGQGPLPLLWAMGNTGVGKTVHANLVCAMFDEPVTSLGSLEEAHLSEGVAEACMKSRLLIFDDPFKDPKRFPFLYRFFLQITNRQLSYHKLYYGSRNVFLRNAVLITDRDSPAYFAQDQQFMRRCYRLRLNHKIADLHKLGIDVKTWWYRTPELEAAVCGLYSWVVDEFFAPPAPMSLDDALSSLGAIRLDREIGYDTLEIRQQREQLIADLVEALVLHGGAKPGDEIAKRVGVGFVEIRLGDNTGISKLCTHLVESLGAVDLTAENLQRVADDIHEWPFETVPGVSVKLEVRCRGRSRIFIRLAQDGLPNKSKVRFVNRDCFLMPLCRKSLTQDSAS